MERESGHLAQGLGEEESLVVESERGSVVPSQRPDELRLQPPSSPRELGQQTTEEWAASVTPLQCEQMIERAMAAHDFKGVLAALNLLRTKDPDRAADVLAVIKAGLTIAVERAAAEVDSASADLIERAREAVRGI